MMSKRLVEEMPEESGLVYRAGESAALFFNSLESSYMQQLAARAKWLNDTLRETSDLELDQLMKKLFNDWVVEFTGNDSFTEVKK
jgi:hypothetical protein